MVKLAPYRRSLRRGRPAPARAINGPRSTRRNPALDGRHRRHPVAGRYRAPYPPGSAGSARVGLGRTPGIIRARSRARSRSIRCHRVSTARSSLCSRSRSCACSCSSSAGDEAVLGVHVLCHRFVDDVAAGVGEPDQAAAPVGRVGDPRRRNLCVRAGRSPRSSRRRSSSDAWPARSGSARTVPRPAAGRRAGRSRRRSGPTVRTRRR